MIANNIDGFNGGYNTICTWDDDSGMMMNIGIIKLEKEDIYVNDDPLEQAILLIKGDVTFRWGDHCVRVKRDSCFDELPICLHVSSVCPFTVTAHSDAELISQGVQNDAYFTSRLYDSSNTQSEVFGKDALNHTSIRTVRTIIDDTVAPYSNLVMGEVINHPGKWSSYPPHRHDQPEVYHYRFEPEEGFGISVIGEEANKISHGSTALIPGGKVHPQCSAPGYAMYYVWMIPHKPKRWLKDRVFEEKHEWLLEPSAVIWSEKDK